MSGHEHLSPGQFEGLVSIGPAPAGESLCYHCTEPIKQVNHANHDEPERMRWTHTGVLGPSDGHHAEPFDYTGSDVDPRDEVGTYTPRMREDS